MEEYKAQLHRLDILLNEPEILDTPAYNEWIQFRNEMTVYAEVVRATMRNKAIQLQAIIDKVEAECRTSTS